MAASLLANTVGNAVRWRASGVAFRVAAQFAVAVVLARLITPAEFGLFTQALIVVGLLDVTAEIGIGAALVQRQDLTTEDIRVAFTLSLIIGVGAFLLVLAAAPLAAAALREPRVVPLIQVLSVGFLLNNCASPSRALLQRSLDFRTPMGIDMLGLVVVYVPVSIALAKTGAGAWALVAASLGESVVRSILSYASVRHSLRLSLARSSARSLLSFGAGLSLARLTNYAARTADNVVVSRYAGTEALGLYARGYQLTSVATMLFSTVVGPVLFPLLSRFQDNPPELRRVFLVTMTLASVIVFPAMVAVSLLAYEWLAVLYGSQWVGAAGVLQILALAGIGRIIYTLCDSLARAKGAVYRQFARHSIYAGTVALAAMIGVGYGIRGVAGGVALAVVLMYILMLRLSADLMDVPLTGLLKSQMFAVACALVGALTAWPVIHWLRAAEYHELVRVFVGTTIVFAVSTAAHLAVGGPPLHAAFAALKMFIPRRAGKPAGRPAENLQELQ